MELQFKAADILKLGTPKLHLHSSQSNDDTGSAWVSAHTDSRAPRVYAFGCEPGTPLSYINNSLDSYDRLNDPIDISSVLDALGSSRYLFVVYEGPACRFLATNSEDLPDLDPDVS
jgi:hypothetical protein